MAAIDLEACVNKFCFYNLGDEALKNIERDNKKKTLFGKLKEIHEVFKLSDFENTVYFPHVKPLFDWRNAFAHGKYPDMSEPNLAIKKNHLKSLYQPINSPPVISEMLELLGHCVFVYRYLVKISKYPIYDFGNMHDLSSLEELHNDIRVIWSESNSIVNSIIEQISDDAHEWRLV